MPASPDTLARFYLHPAPQGDGTRKDTVYIEMRTKGNKNTIFSRPATDQDKADFPRAWTAYQNNSPEEMDGTPVSAMGLGPSQVLNLQAQGIYTVEDLATLGEVSITSIQGGRMLKKRAEAFIKALKAASDVEEEPATTGKKKSAKQKGAE
jgi:hypothetical protein